MKLQCAMRILFGCKYIPRRRSEPRSSDHARRILRHELQCGSGRIDACWAFKLQCEKENQKKGNINCNAATMLQRNIHCILVFQFDVAGDSVSIGSCALPGRRAAVVWEHLSNGLRPTNNQAGTPRSGHVFFDSWAYSAMGTLLSLFAGLPAHALRRIVKNLGPVSNVRSWGGPLAVKGRTPDCYRSQSRA